MAKRPPIEGIPVRRPTCPACGRPAPMLIRELFERDAAGQRVVTHRIWRAWKLKAGVFCRDKCGLAYGREVFIIGRRPDYLVVKEKDRSCESI